LHWNNDCTTSDTLNLEAEERRKRKEVKMSSGKYVFTKALKELRFHHCQTSDHSNAVRYISHPQTTCPESGEPSATGTIERQRLIRMMI